ncbi:hypothetical protein HWV62_1246 [Athelia sp. TMB]|nr:hypothetical protein HWV62_1246 [Athelia sp. TMB]
MYIDGFGNLEVFVAANWLLAVDPMLVGMVACMCQLFFAWRLHVMVQLRWLTTFVIVFSFFTLCGGLAAGISIFVVKSYSGSGYGKPFGIFWQVSTLITDITITVSVTYHLHRRKGIYEATDRLLDSIIQLTIQNGFLTSIVAVVDMSFYIYALYANTVLSSLNARKRLRPLVAATVDMNRTTDQQTSTFIPARRSGTYPPSPEDDLEADNGGDSQSEFDRK